MKLRNTILSLLLCCVTGISHAFVPGGVRNMDLDLYGDTVKIAFDDLSNVDFNEHLSQQSIHDFYDKMNAACYEPLIASLLVYKEQDHPDDWMYYQLVRKVAQYLSPKEDNYNRYTLYKWFLLCRSGYDARLRISGNKMLFYVQSNDNIYDIPFYMVGDKQYVCLNYHDFGSIDLKKNSFEEVAIYPGDVRYAFSYKLTQLPRFKPEDYQEKDLEFNFQDVVYKIRVKLNPQVKNIFANYPVADYSLYFNAPMSHETYSSLIPQLKKNIQGLSEKNGVDYLMRFTRYAFLYEPDKQNFGKEKRLSPEQTLLYGQSDCEDRSALFFYLVKEIYDLPMIVMASPQHVTVAVKLDKPVGTPIMYKGERYTICEPTPQSEDVPLGRWPSTLTDAHYDVVYSYEKARLAGR